MGRVEEALDVTTESDEAYSRDPAWALPSPRSGSIVFQQQRCCLHRRIDLRGPNPNGCIVFYGWNHRRRPLHDDPLVLAAASPPTMAVDKRISTDLDHHLPV